MQIKELHLLDLSKQLAEINTRLRQFAAMYEVVKSERNSFANSIQSASQSIAEMRERIKILKNEVDILQNESLAKDKALAKEKQAHTVAAVQRDGECRLRWNSALPVQSSGRAYVLLHVAFTPVQHCARRRTSAR